MRRYLLLFSALFFLACSKGEEPAKQLSSLTYSMNGAREIPNIGVPSEVSSLRVGDSLAGSSNAPSCLVPIPNDANGLYAFAEGPTLLTGTDRSYKIIAALPQEKPIIQILADEQSIYAIHLSGTIHAYTLDGKKKWDVTQSVMLSCTAVIAQNLLVVASDSAITSYDLQSGRRLWSHEITGFGKAMLFDKKTNLIVVAGIAERNGKESDSLICFSGAGKIISTCSLPFMRIVSNLSLCGEKMDKIGFGCIELPSSESAVRTLRVVIYDGIETGHPKQVSVHEVPYIPMNISSNGGMLLSSGFREDESGIDAFASDDTLHLWQRRFTEPMVAPVVVNAKYAYCIQSFATQAQTPSKNIFYTIDLSTGKTMSELPVTGANSGALRGMPMPIAGKAFALCSQSNSMIYFLRP
ncbi:MAG: PQQ-binding-like beta-propeller repeat protein [bacterium]